MQSLLGVCATLIFCVACAHPAPETWMVAADSGRCAEKDASSSAPVAYDKSAYFYALCVAGSGDSTDHQDAYKMCMCRLSCMSVSDAQPADDGDRTCLGKTCSEWEPTCSKS